MAVSTFLFYFCEDAKANGIKGSLIEDLFTVLYS